MVNKTSTKVKVEVVLDAKTDLSAQLEVLKPGIYALDKADPTPVAVTGRKFAGSESARQGINGLAVADDVTIVVVPDLITAATKEDGSVDLGLWKAVQTSLISHCEQHGNRMAILDAPPGMSPQQIKEWRSDVAMYDSGYAALYYPWIKVENPVGTNGDVEVLIPPSGHIAGVWARTDETRGVWKAPANDTIRGCLDIEYAITQNEQAVLNPIGINCIRPFGTRGIRIWGARTLSSDTDWRYINVRRLFNMIESTIAEGTQWAVFEPNDMTPVGGHQAHAERVPARAVERGRAVRCVGGPGLLRQVRRRDQPAGVDRPGPADRRGRHRAGEAGGVRGLPDRAAEAVLQLIERAASAQGR